MSRQKNISNALVLASLLGVAAGALAADQASPPNSLTVADSGDVGVGTATPGEALDLVRDSAASRLQISSFTNNAAEAAQVIQRRSKGSEAAPTAVLNGDNLGLFSFRGMRPNGNFSGTRAAISVQATQNWNNASNGAAIKFLTTANGTGAPVTRMEITHDGKVLIGGTELTVPDYVFEPEYELLPLDELKSFIQTKKHLPNVANSEEIKRNGLDLGGSQMALLEKIEELTLYVLQQHERLESFAVQTAELQELKAEVADLKSFIDTRLSQTTATKTE